MLNHFFLCEEAFSRLHGSQSPEKYLFLSLFGASKMSEGHFIRWYASEVPWKLPQIFVPDKHFSTKVLPASKWESASQKQMTLCHIGVIRIYTAVPGTLNKHNSFRRWAWRQASFVFRHPCPPLTYLWNPGATAYFKCCSPQLPHSFYTNLLVSAQRALCI